MTPQATVAYTLEEFPWDGEFGPDLIDIELTVAYSVCPYDPGVRYTKNGDGYPPSGGGVEDVALTVKSATSYDDMGRELRFNHAALREIEAEVNRSYDTDANLRSEIQECCCQDAAERDSADAEAYADFRNEASENHDDDWLNDLDFGESLEANGHVEPRNDGE